MDDGSTDDTAKVAASLGARVITQRNSGPAVARNMGINVAENEWVALLDADDRWFPEKLEQQSGLCLQADIVYTGVVIEHESNGLTTCATALPPSKLWPMLLYRNPVCPSTVLARRQMLLQIPFMNGRKGCEDWDCWVRAYRVGARFACVPEPLVYYREAASGSVSSTGEKMLADFLQILEPTLLDGMKGWTRWSWRRRIFASQLFSAAMIERARGRIGLETKYLLHAVLKWPPPFFRPERYYSLAYRLLKPWKRLESARTTR